MILSHLVAHQRDTRLTWTGLPRAGIAVYRFVKVPGAGNHDSPALSPALKGLPIGGESAAVEVLSGAGRTRMLHRAVREPAAFADVVWRLPGGGHWCEGDAFGHTAYGEAEWPSGTSESRPIRTLPSTRG